MIDANKPKFRSFDSTSRSNLNPESRSESPCKFHSLSTMMNQCGFFFFLFFKFEILEKKERGKRDTRIVYSGKIVQKHAKKRKKNI